MTLQGEDVLQRSQSQQPGQELGCSEHTARVCRKPEPVGARGPPGQSLGFTSGGREHMCYGKNILCRSANFAKAFSGEESNTVQSSGTKGCLDYLELEGSFG